jgi:hypothetical protein
VRPRDGCEGGKRSFTMHRLCLGNYVYMLSRLVTTRRVAFGHQIGDSKSAVDVPVASDLELAITTYLRMYADSLYSAV